MQAFDEIARLFAVKEKKGCIPGEIEAAKKLCGGMPLVLERFFLELGRTEELQHLQDTLILPGKHPIFLDWDYLIFFNENQGVCQAGIRKSDLVMDDPPVYVQLDEEGWDKSTDSVSEFLLAMYGYQASICLPYCPENFYWVTEAEAVFIERHFPKRPERLARWLSHEITLYGGPDARIALMDCGMLQMNYAANNPEDLRRIQAALRGVGEVI